MEWGAGKHLIWVSISKSCVVCNMTHICVLFVLAVYFYCWTVCCVPCVGPGPCRADWFLHLMGDRWSSGQPSTELLHTFHLSVVLLPSSLVQPSSTETCWEGCCVYASDCARLPSLFLFLHLRFFLSFSKSLLSCPVTHWLHLDSLHEEDQAWGTTVLP